MRYKDVKDNILDVIERVSPIRIEQLFSLFNDEVTPKQLLLFIKHLLREKVVEIDSNGYIKTCFAHQYQDYMTRALVAAHWIPATFGSKAIREIWLCGYPTVLAFTTEDGKAYDITYAETQADVKMAVEKMKKDKETREKTVALAKEKYNMDIGEGDGFNHILLVPHKDYGIYAIGAGFNSYCVWDEKRRRPNYYQWE